MKQIKTSPVVFLVSIFFATRLEISLGLIISPSKSTFNKYHGQVKLFPLTLQAIKNDESDIISEDTNTPEPMARYARVTAPLSSLTAAFGMTIAQNTFISNAASAAIESSLEDNAAADERSAVEKYLPGFVAGSASVFALSKLIGTISGSKSSSKTGQAPDPLKEAPKSLTEEALAPRVVTEKEWKAKRLSEKQDADVAKLLAIQTGKETEAKTKMETEEKEAAMIDEGKRAAEAIIAAERKALEAAQLPSIETSAIASSSTPSAYLEALPTNSVVTGGSGPASYLDALATSDAVQVARTGGGGPTSYLDALATPNTVSMETRIEAAKQASQQESEAKIAAQKKAAEEARLAAQSKASSSNSATTPSSYLDAISSSNVSATTGGSGPSSYLDALSPDNNVNSAPVKGTGGGKAGLSYLDMLYAPNTMIDAQAAAETRIVAEKKADEESKITAEKKEAQERAAEEARIATEKKAAQAATTPDLASSTTALSSALYFDSLSTSNKSASAGEGSPTSYLDSLAPRDAKGGKSGVGLSYLDMLYTADKSKSKSPGLSYLDMLYTPNADADQVSIDINVAAEQDRIAAAEAKITAENKVVEEVRIAAENKAIEEARIAAQAASSLAASSPPASSSASYFDSLSATNGSVSAVGGGPASYLNSLALSKTKAGTAGLSYLDALATSDKGGDKSPGLSYLDMLNDPNVSATVVSVDVAAKAAEEAKIAAEKKIEVNAAKAAEEVRLLAQSKATITTSSSSSSPSSYLDALSGNSAVSSATSSSYLDSLPNNDVSNDEHTRTPPIEESKAPAQSTGTVSSYLDNL